MGGTAVVEKANALNGFIQRLFVIGGQDDDGYLSDVWSWVTDTKNDEGPWDWVEDYSTSTDQASYVDGDSSVALLVDNVVLVGEFELQETKVVCQSSSSPVRLRFGVCVQTLY